MKGSAFQASSCIQSRGSEQRHSISIPSTASTVMLTVDPDSVARQSRCRLRTAIPQSFASFRHPTKYFKSCQVLYSIIVRQFMVTCTRTLTEKRTFSVSHGDGITLFTSDKNVTVRIVKESGSVLDVSRTQGSPVESADSCSRGTYSPPKME